MKNQTNTQQEQELILNYQIAKDNYADWKLDLRKFGRTKFNKGKLAKYAALKNSTRQAIIDYRKANK